MLLKGTKAQWIVAPLAALFLLFSTGAAAAPDCHVGSTVQPASKSEAVHNHAAHPHGDSTQISTSALSNPQEAILSAGGSLNNEMCVVVGFIVLLLLRFARVTKSILTSKKFSISRFQLPIFLPRNLGYLNLTHLKLGIIRI
jgi:hypothetical protein